MKLIISSARVLLLCILVLFAKTAQAIPLTIDARTDLTKLKIAESNAVGDGATDDSSAIQAAINYLGEKPGGGTLVFAPGVYRIGGLTVLPSVKIVGASREKTIFRAATRAIMFDMRGGELHNFTVYGTPDEASSGDFWKVGTGGVGKNGSAWASFTIRVGDSPRAIAKDVLISNVTAKEARYDCLYTRGSQNLRVLNCEFDRAGRNIISLVGNDENFLIANCRFGSLFGLYHSDIEPNKNHFVRDGVFLNCEFDGRSAGEMDTGTWGAMFIFSGHESIDNRNISVIGSTFHEITTRVRGVFPDIQFLYNPQVGKLIKVRTNPTGELRDAIIRGNYFGTPEHPLENVSAGVTFTGKSTFEDNLPAAVNSTKITAPGGDTRWEEDHPLAVKPPAAAATEKISTNNADGKIITVPLMGHRLNFADGTILKNRDEGSADLVFHTDPLMAEGNAQIQILPANALQNSIPIDATKYGKTLWDVKTGDVVAIKTNSGQLVQMKILAQTKDSYTVQYKSVK